MPTPWPKPAPRMVSVVAAPADDGTSATAPTAAPAAMVRSGRIHPAERLGDGGVAVLGSGNGVVMGRRLSSD